VYSLQSKQFFRSILAKRFCADVCCIAAAQEQSLRVLSFEARAGRAICPYDPSSNYTVVYVGKLFLHTLVTRLCIRGRYLAANHKKLSYRRGTARCVVSVEILPIATQQCRNYLYDKS